LNEKLYSKILLALDNSVLQTIISRKHLRGDGIGVLQELVQTYKPVNVPEVVALKTVEFWGHTKRCSNETIDQYFHRFHELLEDLLEADEAISTKSAIRQFIFTLGSEFEQIQNNYRINNLPSEWSTQDWPTILVLCRNYFNSVRPNGVTSKDSSGDVANIDRAAQQKKVRDWFLNPLKFCREIEKEQSKFPNMCIFHLTDTHSTDTCSVKKNCERQFKQPKESGPKTTFNATSGTGQLLHITEEPFEDAVADEPVDCQDDVPNDTNDAVLNYFELVSRHYLRLVNGASSVVPRHPMQYPIIADSGANYHMFKDIIFFDTLTSHYRKSSFGGWYYVFGN